jgi:hypothetical protein
MLNGKMLCFIYDTTSSATQDIPFVITPDGNSGNGRWLQQDMSTAIRFFHGVIGEKFNAVATSDGATVTLTVTNQDGGDLTAIHPSRRYTISCPDTVTLTAGTDSSPTENYVYYLESAPTTLAVSTSDWPAANHIKIAFLYVPSATQVQSDGCYINQNWNEGTKDDDTGHLQHMAENMRLTMGGSVYHSGVAGNGVDDYITVVGQAGIDDAYFKSTAGISYQMHRHTIPAYDMSTGDDAHVVNYNGTPYYEISNLSEIIEDASGVSLLNRYYNLVFWFANNKSNVYSPLMINLPTGSYLSLSSAINDVDGYDTYSIPAQFSRESSTGMLVCRVTMKYAAAGGGTLTVENTTDLRGSTPGTVSGSISFGTTEFPDNTFKIFDNTDDTKEIQFLLDGLTTSTTRVITPADADMKILSSTNHDDLTDGGDTTLHDHDGISENTTHRSSNGSDHGYIDQDVTSGASPTLKGTNFDAAEWTEQQGFNETAITSTSNSVAWDLDSNQTARHTLTENTTFAAPTNQQQGTTYYLRVIQAAGLYTIAWNSVFKWGEASTPAAPAASGDEVLFAFYSDGTNMIAVEANRQEA